jgi:hypothetical protein
MALTCWIGGAYNFWGQSRLINWLFSTASKQHIHERSAPCARVCGVPTTLSKELKDAGTTAALADNSKFMFIGM